MRVDSAPPIWRDPWFRALIILLTIIAALYLGQILWVLVSQVADFIVLFVVAWIISFVLQPGVTAISRLPRLSKTLAVLLVYLTLFLVLTVAAIVLLPALAFQSTEAAKQVPGLFTELGGLMSGIDAFLTRYGVSLNYGEQLLRPLESIGPAVFSNVVLVATGAATALVQIMLVIIVSLYLMLDGDRLGSYVLQTIPPRYRDDFTYFVSSVYSAFGGFLRGQIIQSLVYGGGIAVIMLATGQPYVALVSVLAGLAIFIPFLGPFLGFLPTLFVALTTVSASPGAAIASIVLTLVLNVLVINVVAPKVMSQSVGLHPILVLAAVMVGARISGPWGALFGVPVAAVIATMVSFYRLTVSDREKAIRELTGLAEPAQAATLTAESDPGRVAVGSD
ncbi:MAG: hypothetical protein HW416_1926 [Chloroflexi bacterium]|nr:hypothetical protein [Chloroflexota bacterium]